MDVIDHANEICEMDLTYRIRNIRMQNQSSNESATDCENCGKKIPLARRKAMPGCTLCVACKTAQESGGF